MLDWVWYSKLKSFACFKYNTFKRWILGWVWSLTLAIQKIEILEWVIYSLFKILDILHSKLECWIPNIKKVLVTQFLPFFLKAIFDKSAYQDPHFVSHTNGPFSRHNTAWRPQGGGGYSDLSFIRRFGSSIYCSPQKISGISSTPKKYSSYPPKIFIFPKTKTNIKIQNSEPENGPKIVSEYDQEIPQSQTADNREEEPHNHHEAPGRHIKQSNQLSKPTYVWKYQSTPPFPLGQRRWLDVHSLVDNVWRIQQRFQR